ncbi:MAG: iron-sulfur cluster assembly scaffold protein [Candidatus Dormibacteraeota bacterium]|nr:iron-sulfur cluster assembly scaffold protein [Candidatus Dormibacteraeota bacterium]
MTVHGHDPLCGDEVDLSLRLRDGELDEEAFQRHECSTSRASAWMIAEGPQARPLSEVRDLISRFRGLLVEGKDPAELGDLGDR